LLEYPQYTRPAEFRGLKVPEVLLSGHHGEIAKWRRRQALRRTFERRPDLLAGANLTAEERETIKRWMVEGENGAGGTREDG
jgi:tRNA (guanine37-N1)-methyltransferase